MKETIEADLNKHFSRYEDPLWDEDEGDKKSASYRIKLSNSNDINKLHWKVFKNNGLVFIIEGKELTKEQIIYLKTVEGINFALDKIKKGCNSMEEFKKVLG